MGLRDQGQQLGQHSPPLNLGYTLREQHYGWLTCYIKRLVYVSQANQETQW